MTFNPLDHPIIWSRSPSFGPSAEVAHLSFGQLVVDLVRPRTIADVGSRSGAFYTALCHAVQEVAIETTSIALLDPALGQGSGDPSLDGVVDLHEQRFAMSSHIEIPATLSSSDVRMDAVDLLSLHPAVLGNTGAEAGRHGGSELADWLACLSERGVAILHDSNVTSVASCWVASVRELESRHRAVRLLHGDGLVLVCPGEIPTRLAAFVECAEEGPDVVRTFFSDRGTRAQLESALHARDREAEAAGHQARRLEASLRAESKMASTQRDDAIAQRDDAIAQLDRAVAERDGAMRSARSATSRVAGIEASAAWRTVMAYRSLVERLLPLQSARRRAYRRSIHVVRRTIAARRWNRGSCT